MEPKAVEPPTYLALDSSVGRVIQVHQRLRFVVLDYTLSRMPGPGTKLLLYRTNGIVGSLKMSPWTAPYTAAADFVEGTPEIGDEARPE